MGPRVIRAVCIPTRVGAISTPRSKPKQAEFGGLGDGWRGRCGIEVVIERP